MNFWNVPATILFRLSRRCSITPTRATYLTPMSLQARDLLQRTPEKRPGRAGRALPALLLLLLVAPIALQAQSISLFQIDPSAYPTIRANVLAIDNEGNPVKLTRENLRLTEGGEEREITLLSCPDPQPIEPVSSVLALDISSSMRELSDRNMTIARAAAHAWIDGLPLGVSECAITSFTTTSFLNQDFTINSRRLSDAVDNLRPDGGTSYNGGFISPVTGAIPVALRGVHKRVIVFLTDGRAGGDEDEIVRQALDGDITIHCITIGFEAPPILKNIAERTGGLWFENVETPEQAADIYRLLLTQVGGGAPCTIEWLSKPACDSVREVTLEESSLPATTSTSYIAPPAGVIQLNYSPQELRYGVVDPGNSDTRTIRLSAPLNDVTIASVTSSDPRFTIESGAAPPGYTIPGGSTQNIIVRFTPTDRSYVFAEITIATLDCEVTVYAAGGQWGGSDGGDPPPEIRLLFPNGGERFPVGINTNITWTGVLPTDTVRLDYSIDGGTNWLPVTDRATGLSHPWRVPNTPSETCLARVSVDSLAGGGGTGSPLFRVLHTYTEHRNSGNGGDIVEARFSPDGGHVASISNNFRDRVEIWNTLNGSQFDDQTPGAEVYDLDYAAGQRRVAVATEEGGGWIRVYSLDGGATISIPAPGVRQVSLQRNGNLYLASGHANGEVRIWRADGMLDRTIPSAELGLGEITAIEFDPTRPEFVVGGTGPGSGFDTIKIYGIDGRLQEVFPRNAGVTTHTLGVNSLRFSADGRRFVSVGPNAKIYVWSRFGGAPALELAGHNDAAFSPDGSLIVVGDGSLLFSDGRDPADPKVFDGVTGALFAVLRGEHTGAVTDVDITTLNGVPYIVSAGLDSTVVVWELQTGDSTAGGPGVDISDNLWAIITAEIATQDVDFGARPVNSTNDSVVTTYLRNSGEVPLPVERITINGADRGAFEIISSLPPFTIPARGVLPVEFRFTPNRTGPFTATVIIESAIDTIQGRLDGEGVAPLLGINASIVDFGRVEVGDTKDSIVTMIVTNLGSQPLPITDITQGGPDLTSFKVLEGDAPFTIPPGASHTMRLSFTPAFDGATTGSLLFSFNGPDAPATVLLFGDGFCPSDLARARATVSDVTAGPGDTVAVPFEFAVIDNNGTGPISGQLVPLRFQLTLRANSTLLTPLRPEARGTIVDGMMRGQFSGTWDPEAKSIVWDEATGPPTFLAGLGNAETTPIEIEEVLWLTGCPPDVALTNSLFTLNRLCREGDSVRLFHLGSNTLKLTVTGSNPTTDRLDLQIGTIEEGRTQLRLVDLNGRVVREVLDAPMVPGSWGVSVDMRGVAAGGYWVVLETETGVRVVRVLRGW